MTTINPTRNKIDEWVDLVYDMAPMTPMTPMTESWEMSEAFLRCWGAWLLLAVGLCVLLPGIAHLPLLDRDEPRFAHATVEMMRRGEWIVPYFNNQLRFDKPVLTYWLMRAGYALSGIDELGARLSTVVCALLTGLTLYWFGRRRYSARHGFLAGLGMLTCLQMLLHGRLALADMPMVLCVTVAMLAAHELLYPVPGARPWSFFFLLYNALGLGFLAKGPIALLVPLLALLLHRWVFRRKPLDWMALKPWRGLLLTVCIIAVWGVPALIATHGEFWREGIGYHVIRRGMAAFNDRTYIPGVYYLVAALFSLCPWIVFLVPWFCAVRRRWDDHTAYLVSWLVAPHLIFMFYATQLPHYVMPGFPAFFLILGHVFADQDAPPVKQDGWRIMLTVLYLALALALLALHVCLVLPRSFANVNACLAGGAVCITGLVLLTWTVPRRRVRDMVLALLCVGAGFGLSARALRPLAPAIQLQPIFRALPPDTPCACWKFSEPSLVFYSGQVWQNLETGEEIEVFLNGPAPRLFVALEAETDGDDLAKHALRRFMGQANTLHVKDYSEVVRDFEAVGYEQAVVEGVNLAKTSHVRLRVLIKRVRHE